MHNFNLKKYYFINKFDKNHLEKLNKKISIIYRNYKKFDDVKLILELRNFFRKRGTKFFLANNVKLAVKLNLDGVYLPSFNKNLLIRLYKFRNNFSIIGSAHNIKELRIKLNQGCGEIFLSPVFKKKSYYLGLYGLINLMQFNTKKTIALGGIDKTNRKILDLTGVFGFAAINYFDKKKAPNK